MLKIKNFDCYDGLCFCQGLVFYAPVSLLVRTRAGLTVSQFFLLQGLLSAVAFLGEVPAGILTDRIGCKRTLVLSNGVILLARITLLAGFLLKWPGLFALEAVLEGFCVCFTSGTTDAYLYEVFGEERYIAKAAQSGNWGTAGFLLSTGAYALLYGLFGIPGLLAASAVSAAGGLVFALGLTPERRHSRPASPKLSEMVQLVKQGKIFVILGSVFSLAGLLVNFFYAEKLLACGLDAEWMSPIILGYSLVGMLAKGILDALRNVPKAGWWAFSAPWRLWP